MKKREQQSIQRDGQVSRRSFIKRVWGLLGLLAGVELLWVGSGFFRSGKTRGTDLEKQLVVAGKVDDFRHGDVFPFRNGQFYLVRYDNGGFLAVSLKCSHLGCSVMWDSSSEKFNCPCHASAFDKFGQVANPPAPRPLDVFPVVIQKGLVMVNTSEPMKRHSFDQSQITFA